jgi:hypothetical protein
MGDCLPPDVGQPLLSYLFSNDNDTTRSIVLQLIQKMIDHIEPNKTDIYSKIHSQCTAICDSTDIMGYYFLLLMILPDSPSLIQSCKRHDCHRRVDAMVTHTRYRRSCMMGWENNQRPPSVYHVMDFVYQSIVYYSSM